MSKPLYNAEHHRIAEYISRKLPGIAVETAYGIVQDYDALAAVEKSPSGNRITRKILINGITGDVGEILLWNGFDGKQAMRSIMIKGRNIPEGKFIYIDQICRPIFYEDKRLDETDSLAPTPFMGTIIERDRSDYDNFTVRAPLDHDAKKAKRD